MVIRTAAVSSSPSEARKGGVYMDVSLNGGFSPKSSILIGCSIINHPFWGTIIFGNTHINHLNDPCVCVCVSHGPNFHFKKMGDKLIPEIFGGNPHNGFF